MSANHRGHDCRTLVINWSLESKKSSAVISGISVTPGKFLMVVDATVAQWCYSQLDELSVRIDTD